jgi:hypothetical protein
MPSIRLLLESGAPDGYLAEDSSGVLLNESAYFEVIRADAPVGYWRLGEASGTVALDEIGTNLGTYTASPTLGRTGIEGAGTNTAVRLLNASAQYVDFGNPSIVNTSNSAISYELWFKHRVAPPANRILVSKGLNSSITLGVTVTGKVFATFWNVGDIVDSGATLITDATTWHHLVFTHDSTGNAAKLYLDGVDRTTNFVSRTLANEATNLTLGKLSGDTSAIFDGDLDEFAVYSFVLTGVQALAHYNAALAGSTLNRTLTEAITQLDAWTRLGTFRRTLTEGVTQSDAWTGLKVILRSWSESVAQADVWTRTATFTRTLTEAIASADVWTRVGTFRRSLTESVTSSDAWTRAVTLARSFAESVAQSDAWASVAGALAIVGGLAPVARAAAHRVAAFASHFRPGGSAGSATPSGEATNPKPRS